MAQHGVPLADAVAGHQTWARLILWSTAVYFGLLFFNRLWWFPSLLQTLYPLFFSIQLLFVFTAHTDAQV